MKNFFKSRSYLFGSIFSLCNYEKKDLYIKYQLQNLKVKEKKETLNFLIKYYMITDT